jgi:uncharacterized membrane protein (Fun14 family)
MNVRLLLPAIVMGTVIGLAVGYSVYKVSGGIDDFVGWMSPSLLFGGDYDGYFWMTGERLSRLWSC